ncbi:MAG TPA: choloylglycine hydrolase family protein [Rhabdochlamydiaceae bacterium]|jgi:choloylglycine hydrolase
MFHLSLLCFFLGWTSLYACTGIKLMARDGAIVHGRTMEFGLELEPSLVVVPRGQVFSGTTSLGSGITWRAKYGALGMIAFHQPAILDGINEAGLCVGTFYFPGYAEYAQIQEDNLPLSLSPVEFPHWILTQFATIEEVRAALSRIVIASTSCEPWKIVPPFHYLVFDKKGKCIVIEPVQGQLAVYENKLGVLTNSPAFNWHMNYLRNFIHLAPELAKPLKWHGIDVAAQGASIVGMPGDFTATSRFVRAALLSTHALRSENSDSAVYDAFHILNQFDIPFGVVREEKAGLSSAHTALTCVRDPQALKYYFKTYQDPSIRMVDLNQFDLNEPYIKRIRVAQTDQPSPAADISSELE